MTEFLDPAREMLPETIVAREMVKTIDLPIVMQDVDLEIAALNAVDQALQPLDVKARNRVLQWAMAKHVNLPERERIEQRARGGA